MDTNYLEGKNNNINDKEAEEMMNLVKEVSDVYVDPNIKYDSHVSTQNYFYSSQSKEYSPPKKGGKRGMYEINSDTIKES